MGVPSATQIQNLTDRLAALIRKDLDGFEAEAYAATNSSLWTQVDAIGDAASEAALGPSAFAIDRQSLPENHADNLRSLFLRSNYRSFVTALNGLVKSADGGSYATMVAYLLDKSAALHPLAAELFRSVLGEAALTSSSLVNSVFAPNYQSKAPDRVYRGADGALTEETADAGSAATADVTLTPTNGQSVYIGSRVKFNQVVIALSTLGSHNINAVVSYWNGNAWVAVSGLTDNSTGLTKNDTIKWTLPTDWVPYYKDGGGTAFADLSPLYYIKITRANATGTTSAVGTSIRIIPAAILNASGVHLGVDQPPLAIARITGTNTIAVEALNAAAVARWKAPTLRLRALTPFGANLTPTVSYVNQAGANQTQAQSAWTAPAALDTVAVTLNGADTGAQSILTTGWAVTTTATEGVFEVYHAEDRTPAL